jgi:hypothetical protein
VKEFSFVPPNLHIDAASYAVAEIPVEEYAGAGIVVVPSYLTNTGILRPVIYGLSSTEFPINGYTEFVETQGSFVETVSESLSALVVTIRERYLEGREEFYTHNNVVFVGPRQDTIHVEPLYQGGEVSFQRIDSLLELKAEPLASEIYDGIPIADFRYFIITPQGVEPLRSGRQYDQTEFVKLDSSYLSGTFEIYNEQTEQTEQTDFMPAHVVSEMRDEILASYGVKFFYKSSYDRFPSFKSLPEITREEALTRLTDIDRHNLEFLERVLADSPAQESPI